MGLLLEEWGRTREEILAGKVNKSEESGGGGGGGGEEREGKKGLF